MRTSGMRPGRRHFMSFVLFAALPRHQVLTRTCFGAVCWFIELSLSEKSKENLGILRNLRMIVMLEFLRV
jgi:hypothetical protein